MQKWEEGQEGWPGREVALVVAASEELVAEGAVVQLASAAGLSLVSLA